MKQGSAAAVDDIALFSVVLDKIPADAIAGAGDKHHGLLAHCGVFLWETIIWSCP
jgi:hypothetical protein